MFFRTHIQESPSKTTVFREHLWGESIYSEGGLAVCSTLIGRRTIARIQGKSSVQKVALNKCFLFSLVLSNCSNLFYVSLEFFYCCYVMLYYHFIPIIK